METAPGDIGNYIFIALALVMLYLSLREWILNISRWAKKILSID
jgi:hypothetical protein